VVLAMMALTVSLMGTGFAFGRSAGGQGPTTAAAAVTWEKVDLKNGWAYADYDSFHVAWYKDSDGNVHLRGSLFDGGSGTVAFKLPAAARPDHTVWLSVYAVNGSTGGIYILPTGQVYPFDDNGDANVISYTSLDGVTYST
jgi:hypothetical protein